MSGVQKPPLAELQGFVGEEVVVDTKSSLIFIGKLEEITEATFVLSDVDVHDQRESQTSREVYLIDTKRLGIRKNRGRIHILAREVISISRLADIIEY
jgi:small nuclear ribonucleoprotein (snRNP)-like protein